MTKKAYLIHGTSTRDDDWFPWLEAAVKPAIELDRIWLPNPYDPLPQEWANAIDKQVPVEDGLVLVAHSLGCISAIRFIERHQLKDARLLLVGAEAGEGPLPAAPYGLFAVRLEPAAGRRPVSEHSVRRVLESVLVSELVSLAVSEAQAIKLTTMTSASSSASSFFMVHFLLSL